MLKKLETSATTLMMMSLRRSLTMLTLRDFCSRN